MPKGYYRDIVRLLRDHGYDYDRNTKGSHERWVNASGRFVILPRNLYSRHTANDILSRAGIDRKV
ncbi:MAG: type II toxin-antitoxin system HicA family toxin [Litorimonas sp.]